MRQTRRLAIGGTLAAVTNFRFAPERAGEAPDPGEGHAHLYVDGTKVARVYGAAYHLAHLEPGRHEITYSLNANDHAAYTHQGKPIAATATVVVPEHISRATPPQHANGH